jgi:hypothetical protein
MTSDRPSGPSCCAVSAVPVLPCERNEPMLCDEPIDSTEANEPTLPMDRHDPTDPTDNAEWSDHSERKEWVDPIDQRLFTVRA